MGVQVKQGSHRKLGLYAHYEQHELARIRLRKAQQQKQCHAMASAICMAATSLINAHLVVLHQPQQDDENGYVLRRVCVRTHLVNEVLIKAHVPYMCK